MWDNLLCINEQSNQTQANVAVTRAAQKRARKTEIQVRIPTRKRPLADNLDELSDTEDTQLPIDPSSLSPMSTSRSPTPERPSGPLEPPVQLHPDEKPSYWHIVLGHASCHTLRNMKILKNADFNVDCIACLKAQLY